MITRCMPLLHGDSCYSCLRTLGACVRPQSHAPACSLAQVAIDVRPCVLGEVLSDAGDSCVRCDRRVRCALFNHYACACMGNQTHLLSVLAAGAAPTREHDASRMHILRTHVHHPHVHPMFRQPQPGPLNLSPLPPP